jgi:hypothetical protein
VVCCVLTKGRNLGFARSAMANVDPMLRHGQHGGETLVAIKTISKRGLDVGTEVTRQFDFRDAFGTHALGNAIIDVVRIAAASEVHCNFVARRSRILSWRAHVSLALQLRLSIHECDAQLLSVV